MSDAIAVQHGAFGRCGLYKLNKALPTHAHFESHLLFHIDGQPSEQKVDNNVYALDGDSVVAINPLQPHSGEFGRNGGESLVLVFYIRLAWLREMGGERQSLRFPKNSFHATPEIRDGVRQIHRQIERTEQRCDLLTYQLIQACFKQSSGMQYEVVNNADSIPTDHRIRKSLQLINENLAADMTPEQIASQVGLSRPHFYKLFRENIGVTPSVYQNALKIEAAIVQLTSTDTTVNKIGQDLGFASPASFSRFFTANVGIAPANYRRVAVVERDAAVAS